MYLYSLSFTVFDSNAQVGKVCFSPLSWQRLWAFSGSSAIHLDRYTWIVLRLRCSLQKMIKGKCHDKTEYQPRRYWRGTCGRGAGTTRCSMTPTSAGCSPAQCPSQRAVWSSPITTWPKRGTKITSQTPPHTNVPTYQHVPSYVGQSCIKTGFIASSFLPAAKPRRSMDGVWLPGKIKSMGVFRGQGGMVT